MARKITKAYGLTDEPAPQTTGNLYAPLPQEASITGGWLRLEKEGKRRTLRKSAGKAALAAGLLVGIGWLLTKM